MICGPGTWFVLGPHGGAQGQAGQVGMGVEVLRGTDHRFGVPGGVGLAQILQQRLRGVAHAHALHPLVTPGSLHREEPQEGAPPAVHRSTTTRIPPASPAATQASRRVRPAARMAPPSAAASPPPTAAVVSQPRFSLPSGRSGQTTFRQEQAEEGHRRAATDIPADPSQLERADRPGLSRRQGGPAALDGPFVGPAEHAAWSSRRPPR